MITLFRRIRQKLIDSGSITKYLLYALGEILLVVVGILIALQVNNWNEERNNRQQVHTILMGVQDDLLNDIFEAERVIDWYAERDTIINRMIRSQYTNEDYRDPDNFLIYQTGLYWYPAALNRASYELLIENQDIIPTPYQYMVKRLNQLYGQESVMLETGQDYLKDYVEKNYLNQLFEEYEWAIDYQQDRRTDAVINYFQNSSYHRRKLARFDQLNNLVVNSLQNVRDIAAIEYLVIHSLIGRTDPLPDYYESVERVSSDLINNLNNVTYYEESQDLFVTFRSLNNILILDFANSQPGPTQPILIDEIRGDTLSTRSRGFEMVLDRENEQSPVARVEFIQNGQRLFIADKL